METLIVIGLAAIILGFGLFVGMDAYRNYGIRSEENNLVSVLEKARMLSLTNVDQALHGVHITQTQYTIFEGASYAGPSTTDEVFNVGPAFTLIGNPSLPTDIVFRQLDAYVATATQLTVSNGARLITVSINNEGGIDW